MALELVCCKHCGFKFRMDLIKLVNEGRTTVVRSPTDTRKKKPAGSEYIDIQCPKCSKWFEQEVEG